MDSKIKYLKHGEALEKIESLKRSNCFFIIDANVFKIYKLKKLFPKNLKSHVWISSAGESCKNIIEYQNCTDFFLKSGLTRSDKIIAIGGGACSDLAGFVAATILRGVAWEVFPTTLLAMIDASIGGKVAINTALGKNLLGAFHLPEKIYIDLNFLDTLPNAELNSGKGELLKYCLLSRDVYACLERDKKINLKLIKKCVIYKSKIINEDYKESGIRKTLNLGHTFGHAYESCFKKPHGVSVVLGLKTILELYSPAMLETFEHLVDVLKIEIPQKLNLSKHAEQIVGHLSRDKKINANSKIELVITRKVGENKLVETPLRKLKRDFNEYLSI